MTRLKSAAHNVRTILPRLLLLLLLSGYLVAALLTYFDYVEPYLFPLQFAKNKATVVNGNLVLGAYPDYDEIKRLKEKLGVTILISLLNTGLPQEKALYEREERLVKKIGGIELYSFSLNYLDLEGDYNRLIIDKLIGFVREHENSRIYLHCYLGRHRVGLVKKKLVEAGVIKEPQK